MTNGIVSIRKDGEMLYKIITGHDGMHAPLLAGLVRKHYAETKLIPSVDTLFSMANACDFGCLECLVILERNPESYHEPFIRSWTPEVNDLDESPVDKGRYLDTFHVAQFNPRWKYGTAPYVEVVDL